MSDCIFCKIVEGGAPSEKIYEDEHAVAFLDIHPTNRGHTLVIPKKHYRNIFDLPGEEFCRVVTAAKKIAPSIIKAMAAHGINLIMNNDEAAGQIVFHAHLHLVPRFSNDGFRHWRGIPYEEGEMQKTGAAIRAALP
jgi:histidine triad (HIT) family protein